MRLPLGYYIFYFGVDDPDGMAAGPWLGVNSVEVEVRSKGWDWVLGISYWAFELTIEYWYSRKKAQKSQKIEFEIEAPVK